MTASITLTAAQDIRTGAWHILNPDGERIGSVRHRYQVEANAKSIARILSPGAEVRIAYRHARKGTVKKAKES